MTTPLQPPGPSASPGTIPSSIRWLATIVTVVAAVVVVVYVMAHTLLRSDLSSDRPEMVAGYQTAPGSHVFALVLTTCTWESSFPWVTEHDNVVDIGVELEDSAFGDKSDCSETRTAMSSVILDEPLGDRVVMWGDHTLAPYDGPLPDFEDVIAGYQEADQDELLVVLDVCETSFWYPIGSWENPDRVEIALDVRDWEETCATPERIVYTVFLDDPLGGRTVIGPDGMEIRPLYENED